MQNHETGGKHRGFMGIFFALLIIVIIFYFAISMLMAAFSVLAGLFRLGLFIGLLAALCYVYWRVRRVLSRAESSDDES
jgi:membrane protein implicated in regulation of membrane protease activity